MTGTAAPTTPRSARWPRLLAFAAIVLTAANLRPAVTSVGALLPELQQTVGLSATVSGVLTSLPPVCFGLFGLLGAALGRRFGTAPTLVAAMSLTAVALIVRVLVPSPGLLLLGTVAALAGMATGNVLLPVAVKRWFPGRVGTVTGWYSVGLAVGTAAAAGASVPLAEAAGSVPLALAAWSLPALGAALPWLWLRDRSRAARLRRDPDADLAPPDAAARRRVRRHPQTRGLLLYFGLQSSAAYSLMGWLPSIFRDAGVPAEVAGGTVALLMLVGVPVSLSLPLLAARSDDQRPLVVGLAAAAAAGYIGVLVAPAATPWLPWLWAVVLGVGMGAFPLALVLIAARASGSGATAVLSSRVQGAGYLLAASGPLAIGLLFDLTGSWTWPLLALLALQVPQVGAGLVAARPGQVDEH